MSASPDDAAGQTAPSESAGAPVASSAVISEEEASALLENSSVAGVRVFDITAVKINRTRLPNLEYIAKIFAVRGGSSLSKLLGRDVTMKFEGLDRGKCADILAALPNPSSIALVKLTPLPEQALFSVDPPLLLALLDVFFGGSGRVSSDPLAAASSAAQRFLGVMLRSFTADMAASWLAVAAIELEISKQDHDVRFLQFAPAPTPLIVVKFIIEFGAISGAFHWLLPEKQLEPVREKLGCDGSAPQSKPQEPWGPAITAGLQLAQIETRAILGQAQISLRELVRLVPGDVIPIETPEHVVLMAENVPLYNGRFGVSEGHNALKILNGVAT